MSRIDPADEEYATGFFLGLDHLQRVGPTLSSIMISAKSLTRSTLVLLGWLLLARAAVAQDAPQHLQAIQITVGMHLIHAEVAATSEQREKGLMFRSDLGTNDGMLFVFDEPQQQCFWMKNTPIGLTIAFIADDGTIVNLADMQALSERTHCSAKPVRFTLEMKQGWFAVRGIKAGLKLSGVPFKP